MTKKEKAAKEWREFEKLVALIESHLGPKDAIIKSPDHVVDKITGELREVDASVRYQVGSVSILITIECRDRKSVEDTRWIEQLAKKRDDIGANATIAVSSRKFSKPAIKKANFYGIETRLLNEIQEESIHDWANQVEAILFQGKFKLSGINLKFKLSEGNPNPELHPEIKSGLKNGAIEYKFIKRTKDEKEISIGDLLRESESENDVEVQTNKSITVNLPAKSSISVPLRSNFSNLFKDVPLNGEIVKKFLRWDFDFNEANVMTIDGPIAIEYLDIEIHLLYKVYPSNFGKILSYKNDTKTLLNINERKIDIDNGKTISIVISGKSDITSDTETTDS